jgi:3-oxoacyl-[acyl-carrier protein] reductase
MKGLTGRCAIVTGAGSGIGQAVAERLAIEGVRLAILDLNEGKAVAVAKSINGNGGTAVGIRVDATIPNQVATAIDAASELCSISILVNSEVDLRRGRAEDISPAEWDFVMAANLTSAFLLSTGLFPQMQGAGDGRIVNVASMAGRATSTLGGVHYTAAKAGMLGLTRHLAREWATYGIRVNAVSPGIVGTPMVTEMTTPDERSRVLASIPFGRFADPSEVAALICFLASTESSYITGTNVDIHGGELIIQ